MYSAEGHMKGENPGMERGPIWRGLTCSVLVSPDEWRRTMTILEKAVPKSIQAVQVSSTLTSRRLPSRVSVVADGARAFAGLGSADLRCARNVPFRLSLMSSPNCLSH